MSGGSEIRLTALRKRFPGSAADAVEGLDLHIEPGSIVALIGPSGCGKTTTLRMINRLVEPTSGRVEIDGRDVQSVSPTALRRGIGYAIQQVGLFPHRTVAQNIATVPRTLGWERARVRDRVRDLTELVGLEPELLDRYPDELSGGQQQRVGVARALAADPPLLLMDEPFGAVDPIVRGRLQDELLALQARVRKTIVLVTHDIDEAVKVADRVAILNVGGRLEQYAAPDELLRAPASAFVAEFIGDGRGMKRLGLTQVRDLPAEHGPVVEVDTAPAAARARLAAWGGAWLGVTDGGRFLGWVHGEALGDLDTLAAAPRALPAAQVTPDSTLRHAMEVILTADTAVAVIDDGGRFGGIVTLEQIRAGLAADPRSIGGAGG